MAKSLLSVKRKAKPRVTRSEAYMINKKYMGDEPEFKAGHELTQSEYGSALNWYSYMCDKNDAREYIVEYLKANKRNDEVKTLKRVPDTWFPVTIGWVARLLSRGYMPPGNPKSFIDQRLSETLRRATEDEVSIEKPKTSIQDRMKEKVHEIIGEIEEIIDSGEEFSVYDWMKANETPAYVAGYIVGHYAGWLQELIEAYEGPKDAQLVEAYAHMTRKQLKERIMFFHKIISDAEKYAGVAKKTRAPRKPRAQSKEKILKNLKYQKEDNTFKIASINPEKILGAQELWCFNTKYKTLTVFRAIDRGGLNVKRTTIVNYDEKTSFTRGCGRQAEKIVYNILNGGKIVMRKQMDELKTIKALQDRINENTILLKVL